MNHKTIYQKNIEISRYLLPIQLDIVISILLCPLLMSFNLTNKQETYL